MDQIERGSFPAISKSEARRVARKLVAWFHRNRRDLPWRHDRDPYRIWVSEVMLQQTTVNQVVPYFHRFMLAFPGLNALAQADEQEVLRVWEGLGYYRRARDLHAAAEIVALKHGGIVPSDPEQLGELPGMGRYTRNAILSQAFDLRFPIVEANSQRVLCRLFGPRVVRSAQFRTLALHFIRGLKRKYRLRRPEQILNWCRKQLA